MSNKSECHLRRLLYFGLAAGVAMVACRSSGLSPALKEKPPSQAFRAADARDDLGAARGPQDVEATSNARVAIHSRPRLLPVLDALEPAFIDFESPDVIDMVVDGIRIALHSSGAFDIADGTLPVARSLTAMRLPQRLGAGWLFCLASSENTWLMRADTFTGGLTPIGNIEVPTGAVTPGFEGIYVTLRQSGLVLSVDPKTGKTTEPERLPHAPEYGPIAIVSDQLGAYVDPLRGVMTSVDAGRSWQPLDWTRVADAAPLGQAITPSTPIGNLSEDAGELRIDLTNQQHFWFSIRGNVHFAKQAATSSLPFAGASSASFFGRFAPPSDSNAIQAVGAAAASRVAGASPAASRVAGASPAASRVAGASPVPSVRPTEVRRRIRQWLDAWRRGPLGGWPIEVAVTRGAMLDRRTAVVLAKGRLSTLRLRDGRVLESHRVELPVEARCEALETHRELFFLCERPQLTSLYRWKDRLRLEALAIFAEEREVIAYSDSGIVVRGACAANGRDPSQYCVIQTEGDRVDVRLLGATGRERLVTAEADELAVLVPPDASSSGRLIRVLGLGASSREVHVDLNQPSSGAVALALTQAAPASERQGAMLRDSFWLQRPSYTAGELSAWVTKGDDLLGVRIDNAGRLTFGEVVAGATRASEVRDQVLVPDSSGFAFESTDGGMAYRRPQLPLALADVDATIPKRLRVYGCSTVGCRLGDWLRVGWTSATAQALRNQDPLESVKAPDSIRFLRPKRRIPRLDCELTATHATAPREAPRQSSPARPVHEARETTPSNGPTRFESTPFHGFYAVPAPTLAATRLGFERGLVEERLSMRTYAQTPRRRGAMTSYRIDWRVSDALRGAIPWSSTTADVEFDSVETVARAFGHPRYGEHATSWTALGDSDGAGLLWTIEDAGKRRYFLVEPDRPMLELRELDGREPRRITDVARLNDGWYLLGTEPNPRLYFASDGRTRLVSEIDPRARLQASRLRLLKNRSRTRLAYWALSARMRSADVEWLVYPIDVKTGVIDAPTAIPLASGIRPCDAGEDGWVLESSLDLVADAALAATDRDITARATGLFLLNETGVCVDRVLIRGASATAAHQTKAHDPRRIDPRRDVSGRFEDEAGRMRDAVCHITEPGT